jgi:hypothetical protein
VQHEGVSVGAQVGADEGHALGHKPGHEVHVTGKAVELGNDDRRVVVVLDTHFLTLGTEHGFALGGGRMAALFAQGLIGEGGHNAVVAGLRVYFGQRDKTLIDRNRQRDPLGEPISMDIISAALLAGPTIVATACATVVMVKSCSTNAPSGPPGIIID